MPGHLVIVPTTALKDSRLSHAEYKTLCHISTFASTETGWCWFLMSTLANEMGVSVRAAQMHVKRLVDLGYIVREAQFRDGQQKCNRYQVVLNTDLKKGGEAALRGGDEAALRGGDEAQLHTERSSLNGNTHTQPLTREDFLREIDKARIEGRFSNQTDNESLIAIEADLLWSWLENNHDKWPKNIPARFSLWLRQSRAVKAAEKLAAKSKASGGSEGAPLAQASQPWHERMAKRIGEAPARAWIYPLHHDGEKIIAPSKFHRDTVLQKFRTEIEAEFRRGIPIVFGQPSQEQA